MANLENQSKKRYYPLRDAENPYKVSLVEIIEAQYRALYNAKAAVMYTVAYMYEHREEADHHALTITLRSLLFGARREVF